MKFSTVKSIPSTVSDGGEVHYAIPNTVTAIQAMILDKFQEYVRI